MLIRARQLRARGLTLCLAVLVVALSVQPAAAAPAADVRFVVDVSASMADADPDNRRGRALITLLRLLPDAGHGGVWTYGKYVNMLVKHGETDDLWKQMAAAHAAELSAVGARSNLVEAVDRASWDRALRREGARHLVLLTDGRVDVSDSEPENLAEEDRLLKVLMPELAAAGFRIHTLALSGHADLPLLKQLSLSTGGYHARIADPAALADAFLRVFGALDGSSDLPIAADRSFEVDPGVTELTLVDMGDPWSEQLTLTDPEGRTLTRTSPRNQVRWHLDAGYQMVTLENPAVGRWRVGGVAGEQIRLATYSDLEPRLQDLPATVFPGELQAFELALMSSGQPIVDAEFLALLNVTAELEGPEGREPVIVEPAAEGRYVLSLLGVKQQGEYALRVSVTGPTFQRLKVAPFSVRNPLVIEVHPRSEGLVMWTEVTAPGLDHRSLKLAAQVKRPPAPARLFPAERMPGGLWKLAVTEPKGFVEVELIVGGNYLNGKEFSLRSEPIQMVLPIAERQFVHLDLQGRPVLSSKARPDAGTGPAATAPSAAAAAPALPARWPPGPNKTDAPGANLDADPAGGQAAETPRLPLWFGLTLGAVNLLLGFSLWWLVRSPAGLPDLGPALDRLRTLAGLGGRGADAISDATAEVADREPAAA